MIGLQRGLGQGLWSGLFVLSWPNSMLSKFSEHIGMEYRAVTLARNKAFV